MSNYVSFLTLEIARCKIKLIMHVKKDTAENLSYDLNADLKKKIQFRYILVL